MNFTIPFILAQSSNDAAGVFFGLGAVGLIIALLLGIFWLWMLIDALTNSKLDPTMRIVWSLVVFFLSILGALIYFFVGRRGATSA